MEARALAKRCMRPVRAGGLAILLLLASGQHDVQAQATPTVDPPVASASIVEGLQVPERAQTATVGQRVLFAAGTTVVVYDAATGSSSTMTLPEARRLAAVVGSQVLFTGSGEGASSTIDIYDAAANRWSAAQVSTELPARTGHVVGQRVLFVADGDRADVYDIASGQVSTRTLSTPRQEPGVAVAGQQAVIVGSMTDLSRTGPTVAPEARTPVDIYDAATDTWSTAQLSDGRWRDMAVVGLDHRILIAGGGLGPNSPSDAVDIYDTTTGTWATQRLGVARMDPLAVVVGQQALFVAGYGEFVGPAMDPTWTRAVDIYDGLTDTMRTGDPLTAGWRPLGFVVGGQAVFAGGYRGARSVITPVLNVDVYDGEASTWSHTDAVLRSHRSPNPPRPTTAAAGPFGFIVGSEKDVDVYDSESRRWSTLRLPEYSRSSVATVGTRLLVADRQGGVYSYDPAQP